MEHVTLITARYLNKFISDLHTERVFDALCLLSTPSLSPLRLDADAQLGADVGAPVAHFKDDFQDMCSHSFNTGRHYPHTDNQNLGVSVSSEWRFHR